MSIIKRLCAIEGCLFRGIPRGMVLYTVIHIVSLRIIIVVHINIPWLKRGSQYTNPLI